MLNDKINDGKMRINCLVNKDLSTFGGPSTLVYIQSKQGSDLGIFNVQNVGLKDYLVNAVKTNKRIKITIEIEEAYKKKINLMSYQDRLTRY